MTAKVTKEEKLVNSVSEVTRLDALKELGIPVQTAVFHRVVQSFGATAGAGEPETALYAKGAKPSRTAQMLYTPHGLICEQKFGTILVPTANISFVKI